LTLSILKYAEVRPSLHIFQFDQLPETDCSNQQRRVFSNDPRHPRNSVYNCEALRNA
jgi:hypothetical protein